MVNISKLDDSAIKFTFTNNDRYLYNGEITVPLNSLILVLDESDMAVLKKIDGDVFLTFLISNSNFSSKSDLEEWFKENACGSTGGGGVTSGEVETMIETSLEDYYDIDEVDAALSAKANTATTYTKTEVDIALANKADTATTYTKTEVDNALGDKADTSAVTASIAAAVSGKQDTLIAGSGITISGNVISSEGGGGKAIVAGTNISVTTGATADTVNCTLPFIIKSNGIAYNNDYGNIIIGNYNFNGANSIFTRGSNKGSEINYDIIIAGGGNKFTGAAQQMLIAGSANEIKNTSGGYSSAGGNGIIVGQGNKINYSRHNYVFGDYNTGGTSGTTQQEYNNYLLVFGEHNKTNNNVESTFGKYNNSVSGSSTFGDSGNTLFSVGNGTADNARHNAFEIRQNGDIYITSGGTDILLQDALGGGGGVSESAFTSYSAATDARISEDEEVTAAALNALNDGKQDTLIAGSGITISGNVISAEGGNLVIELTQAEYDALVDKDPNAFYIITDATEINISDYYTSAQTQSAINAAVSGKQDTLIAGSGITISGNVISANGGGSITVDTALDSGSTNPVENRVIYDKFDEVEQVTAAALNALNDKFDGLRLKKLTQAEYNALAVKDNNTLYILVG